MDSRMKLPRRAAWTVLLSFLVGLAAVALVSGQSAKQTPRQPSAERLADAAYQKGMQLLNEKRYPEALKEFRLVEEVAPQLPQGPSGQGITFALMGRPEEAIRALKKALEIDSSFWVARRELGIVYWQQNLKEQAAKQLQPLAHLFPEDQAVNLILGQYEFERQNYSQALAFFSKAPSQIEQDTASSLMEAQALIKTGRRTEAGQKLSQLVGRPALAADQSFRLAWLLGQATLYEQSIEVFNSLPPNYPDAFARNYGLALAYFEDKQYAKCVETLEALRAQGITRPELFSLLGVADEKSGNTKAAYDTFREGILANPKNVQNYINIATLASQHLNLDLAVQTLSSGIDLLPNRHELFLSRGIAYTLKGQFAQAQEDFAQAIRIAPQESGNYMGLGLCLLEAGALDPAVRAFEEAASREPKDALPHFFLTEALLQKGAAPNTVAFEKASQAIETALSLDPNFAFAYRDRARLALMAEQTERAISDLERARGLDPHSRTIAYLLAQAYKRKGEKTKADELFALVRESSEQEARRFRQDSLTRALVVLSTTSR